MNLDGFMSVSDRFLARTQALTKGHSLDYEMMPTKGGL